MKSRFVIGAILAVWLSPPGYAYKQDHNIIKITKSERTEALSPEEQLAKFTLPEGFVIELVASEENGIINPIDLTFDDAGRLWTQTAEMYPLDPMGDKANRHIRGRLLDPNSKINELPEMVRLKRLYELKDKGTDRIVVIDDPTKPVEGMVRRVAEGLTMPQSILPYKNGVFVAHGSEMLYLEDADGDGMFEKPTTVLTGFSFIDSHTMSHLLTRAPGGWINFSHGAMNLGLVTAVASGAQQQINYSKIARFSLDGTKLELVASGLNNIWGYDLRADGQYYGSEANDKGMSIVPMEAMTGFEGIGNDKIRPYQPMMPQLHSFRLGGTGLSGLAFSEDDAGGFPDGWADCALIANAITNTINRVVIERDASGGVTATHLGDLLECEDDWFRPVNLAFGPDGCLYVADWYNKVVSHNEIPRSDPSRDKTHGRIWRIRHVSQKPVRVPNVLETPDAGLVAHLKGPSLWEKRAAWHQIADRQAIALLPAIIGVATDTSLSTSARISALWSYESLGEFDQSLTDTLLLDDDHDIRREAIRSLASFDLPPAKVSGLVAPFIGDGNAMLRSQALRTLREVGKADDSTIKLLIEASKPPLPGKMAMGGTYERMFERYLARMAMEQYRDALESFLGKPIAREYPKPNLLWALQSLDEDSFADLFPKFWAVDSAEAIHEETFISLAGVLHNREIQDLLRPVFSNPDNFEHLTDLLIETRDRIDSTLYRGLFAPILAQLTGAGAAGRDTLFQIGLILKSPEVAAEAAKVLASDKSPENIQAILPLLMLDPKGNGGQLAMLARDETLPESVRVETIAAYNRAYPKAGYALVSSLLSGMDDSQRRVAVERFSRSTQGASSLAKLLNEGTVSADDFDYIGATRVAASARKNPAASKLMKTWAARQKAEDKKLAETVEKYTSAASELEGDPIVGGGLFNMCLTCHAVGDRGHSIAPALDGSASRETHALLTAIMRPDVAVEGGYELTRVIRKNGTMVEGYLVSSNSVGVTIATIGDVRTFIPRADVKNEAGVRGKSFMQPLANGLPEQSMIDLISYIKTLK